MSMRHDIPGVRLSHMSHAKTRGTPSFAEILECGTVLQSSLCSHLIEFFAIDRRFTGPFQFSSSLFDGLVFMKNTCFIDTIEA